MSSRSTTPAAPITVEVQTINYLLVDARRQQGVDNAAVHDGTLKDWIPSTSEADSFNFEVVPVSHLHGKPSNLPVRPAADCKLSCLLAQTQSKSRAVRSNAAEEVQHALWTESQAPL